MVTGHKDETLKDGSKDKSINDESLKEALQRKLEDDINLRGYALKADVVEGQAQLQGIVDVLAEKEHAEKIAKGISGIKKVDNAIAVSTDGAITDSAVDFEVAEELNANPEVNLKHIGAKSSGGKVILTGNVTDPDEINTARRSAGKARGVTEVKSQVKVRAPEMTLDQIFHSQVNNDRETDPAD
ncbi:MAG: transporter [Firmicutes bacterium HGW-Firmicutes-14]|jgi:hyperosmotically inducible protein|nr:MAG: transporter [Firmicutes bacterium HGW-Firmicutes-14]